MSGVIPFTAAPAGKRSVYAEQLAKDRVQFGEIAKDVHSLSGAVVECREELRKISVTHPALAKGGDLMEASLAQMDATLSEIARRLDRLAGQPVPLPFLPAVRRETA